MSGYNVTAGAHGTPAKGHPALWTVDLVTQHLDTQQERRKLAAAREAAAKLAALHGTDETCAVEGGATEFSGIDPTPEGQRQRIADLVTAHDAQILLLRESMAHLTDAIGGAITMIQTLGKALDTSDEAQRALRERVDGWVRYAQTLGRDLDQFKATQASAKAA